MVSIKHQDIRKKLLKHQSMVKDQKRLAIQQKTQRKRKETKNHRPPSQSKNQEKKMKDVKEIC